MNSIALLVPGIGGKNAKDKGMNHVKKKLLALEVCLPRQF